MVYEATNVMKPFKHVFKQEQITECHYNCDQTFSSMIKFYSKEPWISNIKISKKGLSCRRETTYGWVLPYKEVVITMAV